MIVLGIATAGDPLTTGHCIRGHLGAVEGGHHRPPLYAFKSEQIGALSTRLVGFTLVLITGRVDDQLGLNRRSGEQRPRRPVAEGAPHRDQLGRPQRMGNGHRPLRHHARCKMPEGCGARRRCLHQPSALRRRARLAGRTPGAGVWPRRNPPSANQVGAEGQQHALFRHPRHPARAKRAIGTMRSDRTPCHRFRGSAERRIVRESLGTTNTKKSLCGVRCNLS
jgi:hypothetical protein